jgi:hypothetical protein
MMQGPGGKNLMKTMVEWKECRRRDAIKFLNKVLSFIFIEILNLILYKGISSCRKLKLKLETKNKMQLLDGKQRKTLKAIAVEVQKDEK